MTFPITKIGRYQLITRIAVGGMAEVFLARHGELSGFKTLVVVKKVLPHLASNPEFINMFLDEARIASLLDHPNVVRIYEVGKASHEYFLAMELVQGKPLSSLLRRAMDRGEPMSPRIACLILAHAAAGLHHAHELSDHDGQQLGLVHRDVSPQNILISFEGSVKVIDFGIARALGRLSDTHTGGMKGKTGYMSPEQARGESVDHRTDIFALGVVLWETLCARRLFTKDNDFGTMRAIVYEPVPPPSTVVKVPPALENIIMKALSRDPAARYQTSQDMAAALERFVFQQGGASTADIASLMKSFFAEDQVKWKNTTRVALDMQEGDPPAPVSVPEFHSRTGLSVVTGLPRATGATVVATPVAPPRERWRMVGLMAGAFAVLAVAGAVFSMMSRPVAAPAIPASTPYRASGPTVEALPSPVTEPETVAAPPVPAQDPGTATKRRPSVGRTKRPAQKPADRSADVDRRPNPFE